MSNYTPEYSRWKRWTTDSFGELSRSDEAYFDAEMRRAHSLRRNSLRVLEIGFGNGRFLEYCSRKEWSVCGIEANLELVEIATSKGYSAFHCTDLSTFDPGQFDLVVAFDVIEHIAQPALDRLFRDVSRVLSRGGLFVARFPNGDSPFGLPSQNGDITHVTHIGKGKIYQMASATGLEVLFAGGEAKPFFGVSAVHSLHRLVVWPIKALIDGFVNWVLFPGARLAFCSPNMTVVLRAT